MMKTFVQLKLFATLANYTPENADRYPVSPGSTIKNILDALNIPLSEAKLIFINNVRVEPDAVIYGGERIGIFPPVGGG